MNPSKDARIQKLVASSNAPPQVVTRPIPALSLLIASTHQTALLPTNQSAPNLATEPTKSSTELHKKGNPLTMDTKFPVSTRKENPIAPVASRKEKITTPAEYCGKLEAKQNVELSAPTFNPWSAEAFSIFEGKKTIWNVP